MALTATEKQQIIEKFAQFPGDTGSTEVQVALLTERMPAQVPGTRRRRALQEPDWETWPQEV